MRTKLSLAVLTLLLIAGLIWTNRPHPAPTPAPQPQTSLPKLPRRFIGSSQKPAVESKSLDNFRQMLKDGTLPKLTPEQLEAYLQANHRNAESLLAALYTSGDRAFLREAMEKFPNDPKVDYAALFFGNLSPQEARQWADTFKRSDPNNSMPDYVSAMNYMKSGQPDLAMQDMAAAAKLNWSDYSSQFMQSSEEAYRAAGFSDFESKAASQTQLLLPDLAPLKQLAQGLASQANTYQQAGDPASAQAALQMDMQLGQQLSATEAQPLITTLVGYAIERIALGAMDPSAPYGDSGQTVQDQINQIIQQRQYIKDLTSQAEGFQAIMSDDDYLNYLERRQSSGELSAMRWALNKYSPQ